MRADRWAWELTLTTRGPAALLSAGNKSFVKRKPPRKFVCQVSSCPSAVSRRSRTATPALLTRTSSFVCEPRKRSAARRTEANDAMSISRSSARPPSRLIPSTTVSPRTGFRAPITTPAPILVRARAVSSPMPPVAPVTRTVLPDIALALALMETSSLWPPHPDLSRAHPPNLEERRRGERGRRSLRGGELGLHRLDGEG